jgi:predicted esterase
MRSRVGVNSIETTADNVKSRSPFGPARFGDVSSFRRLSRSLRIVTAVALLMLGVRAAVGVSPQPPARAGQEGLFSLPGELPKDLPRGPLFDYDLKLEREQFYLFVPPNYRGREPFGLIAFVHAADQMNVPVDWKKTLVRRKLLYIAPQNIGNNQPVPRRALLTVAAIRKMIELYEVDPHRVYITGHSGGAKVAGLVAFAQPDLIRGAMPMCGFLFPKFGEKDKQWLEKVKSQVGFALITGSKDFNRQYIVADYNERLVKEKYRVKLFDVPGMGHQIARAQTLNAALSWLESRDAASDADKRPKAAKPKT